MCDDGSSPPEGGSVLCSSLPVKSSVAAGVKLCPLAVDHQQLHTVD